MSVSEYNQPNQNIDRIQLGSKQRQKLYKLYPKETSRCSTCGEAVTVKNSVIKAQNNQFNKREAIYVVCVPCHKSHSRQRQTTPTDVIDNNGKSSLFETAKHRRYRIITYHIIDLLKGKNYTNSIERNVISRLVGKFYMQEITVKKYIDMIVENNIYPITRQVLPVDIRVFENQNKYHKNDKQLVLESKEKVKKWYEKNARYFKTDIDDSLYKGVKI